MTARSAAALLLSACALLDLPGCAKTTSQQVEDTETSGRIQVVSVPESATLVAREIAAFRAAYPAAAIELRTGGSRDAVTALLGQQAALAVLTRDLEPEERSVMVKGGMELEAYRFARDAICVVVHPSNPLEQLSADDLKRVYAGEVTSWRELGGPALPISPVVGPPESDAMVSFVQRVMGGDAVTAPSFRAGADSLVVRRVASVPGAIGFVSLAWADRGAKALRISALRGMPYWKADPEKVYKGDYPLTRYCNLYVRSGGPRLANGLVTFISSLEGQKIVHEAGLVPTSVPVRFARRSPLLGTH
jgi:phosphate transport system substrate-binding protein